MKKGEVTTVRKLTIVLTLLMLVSFVPAGEAESLWSGGGGWFLDAKAHAVGDTLTIIVNESLSAKRSGDTSNSKSSSIDLPKGTGKLDFIPGLGASYKDAFSSKGSVSNTNSVTGRLTVQVIEVKPNGHLVVSGKQSIKQGDDEQIITVTGTVRPEDITSANTVLSTYVANAEIKIDGKGPLAGKQRQGILSQIFDFLF